jgi:hypothetical protein
MSSQHRYRGHIRRLVIVTDACEPQINGVVRTLGTTVRLLEARGLQVRPRAPIALRSLEGGFGGLVCL